MIVLKILLFILLAILGIIILVLISPVIAEISFIGGKLDYRIKFGLIHLLDSSGGGLVGMLMKKKKAEPEEKSVDTASDTQKAEESEQGDRKKQENALEEKAEAVTENFDSDEVTEADGSVQNESEQADEALETPKKKKKSLSEMADLVIGIWNSAKRPLRKILKGFHFTKVYIDFLIANEDAYKCALNYGRISTAVYNLLGVFGTLFTVKYKTVDIECGFAQNKSRWDAGVKFSFVPMTAVIAGIWFLVTYIFRVYLPEKSEKKKMQKTAQKQNTQPQGGM